VTRCTEDKKKRLFETYSCIQSKYRLKNHQNQLNEIIFSEGFLREIGYSLEEFAHIVLEEGIPQLLLFNDHPNDSGIKELMKRYFTLGPQDYETPEFESLLRLKHGYVRKIKYKVFYLMNYENNSFGLDSILAILSKEEPYLGHPNPENLPIKKGFMQTMNLRAKESEYFLSSYYNLSFPRKFENMHKICRVREIAHEEENSFVVKKYEEV